ncbi:MAG: response regulator [Desulfobacterales bacterium]|nr:response regulator [Desulfobacterales bacterium]
MYGPNPAEGAGSPSLFPQHPEGPKRVLLVDDEDGIRRVLSLLLEEMGYEVTEAAHGEEGFLLFESTPFPVVLTDIKMPVMDGIALLKKVKALCPRCEVIMLTGHGDLSLAIQSLRAGAIDFITKPVNDDLLEMALKRAFASVGMMHALHEHTVHLERLVDEKSRALVEAETMAAVGEAVSDVAHAVKGITSALSAGTHVMEEGITSQSFEMIETGWGVVKRNVERAGRLVGNLLTAGKPLKLHFEEVDLATITDDAARLASFRAQALEVNLEVITPSEPSLISGDRESLLIALTNLLENALDALENREEGGHIKMRVETGKITISDTASGVDKTVSKRAFHNAGIGLKVTDRIAKAHGATLTMESGKTGTRVEIAF